MLIPTSIILKYSSFSKNNDLHLPESMLLMCIYHSWVVDGYGINTHEISKALDYKRGSVTDLTHKLSRLSRLGYIEIVGTGRRHSQLFAPTDYCCALIESYFGTDNVSDNRSAD